MTTLYVDNSTLSALAACDTRVLLRYIHGWTGAEDSMALEAGKAVHTALEVFFKTNDRKQALTAFRAAYEAWADAHVPPAPPREMLWVLKYSYQNVRDIVRTWMRRHPLHAEPYKVFPDLVEIGFTYPLADDVMFYGRYDGVVEEKASGQLYVMDHKTTGQLSSDWAETFRLSTQMTGYIWAAEQLMGKRITGAIINGIQISKLPDAIQNKDGSIRKCKDHGIPIDECRHSHVKDTLAITQRTPEQIDTWKTQTLKLIRRLQKLIAKHPTVETIGQAQQQGMFAAACRFCAFKTFCELNRPVDRLPAMLKHEPWKPYEPEAA